MRDEKTIQESNKTNKKIFIILIALIILVAVFLVWQKYNTLQVEILIKTDKTEYEKEGILRVKIQNNFGKTICFSSCYPYYLERKIDERWESYSYAECREFNSNSDCIDAKKQKAFELVLPNVPAGLHRLAIPACLNCKIEDIFRKDKEFYSNTFLIK